MGSRSRDGRSHEKRVEAETHEEKGRRKVCPLCRQPVLMGESSRIVYPEARTAHEVCAANREAVMKG